MKKRVMILLGMIFLVLGIFAVAQDFPNFDEDFDGVDDTDDLCPGTSLDAVADLQGCSCAQKLVPGAACPPGAICCQTSQFDTCAIDFSGNFIDQSLTPSGSLHCCSSDPESSLACPTSSVPINPADVTGEITNESLTDTCPSYASVLPNPQEADLSVIMGKCCPNKITVTNNGGPIGSRIGFRMFCSYLNVQEERYPSTYLQPNQEIFNYGLGQPRAERLPVYVDSITTICSDDSTCGLYGCCGTQWGGP